VVGVAPAVARDLMKLGFCVQANQAVDQPGGATTDAQPKLVAVRITGAFYPNKSRSIPGYRRGDHSGPRKT